MALQNYHSTDWTKAGVFIYLTLSRCAAVISINPMLSPLANISRPFLIFPSVSKKMELSLLQVGRPSAIHGNCGHHSRVPAGSHVRLWIDHHVSVFDTHHSVALWSHKLHSSLIATLGNVFSCELGCTTENPGLLVECQSRSSFSLMQDVIDFS